MIGVIHISATNRGSKRVESDAYYTPEKDIHNFLSKYKITPFGNILEPSAGNGSFIKSIRQLHGDKHFITSVELREDERSNLEQYSDEVVIGDFLTWKPTQEYDLIIGNPPYSIALEFMEKCFQIANEDTVIIMLLRTAFLESKKRYNFWQKHPLTGLYVCSQRPSFMGNGKSDATSYSFMIWDAAKTNTNQIIKVI